MHQILSRMREKRSEDEGFTLIELLVVVVIIGVLVAIAVPVYLNYRQGAADKSAQSDVRNAIPTLEQYYTDNNSSYPGSSALNQNGSYFGVGSGRVELSNNTTMSLYIASNTAASYRLCAFNSGGTPNRYYVYDSAVGGSVSGRVYGNFDMNNCTGA